MIRGTTRDKRMKLGRLAYVLPPSSGARAGRGQHRFRIEVDGRPLRVHAWQILVANVGSMGTRRPSPGARHRSDRRNAGPLRLPRARHRDYFVLGWRLLTGRHRRDDNTIFLPIRREVRIDADRPTAAQGDGEMIGRTPFTLRVAPRAVRVLVPRAVPGAAPATPPAPVSDATAAPKTEVGRDIERMSRNASRTWALQGPWRHPIAGLEALDAALFLRVNRMSLGADGGSRAGLDLARDALRRGLGDRRGAHDPGQPARRGPRRHRHAAGAVVDHADRQPSRSSRGSAGTVRSPPSSTRVIGVKPRDFSFPRDTRPARSPARSCSAPYEP